MADWLEFAALAGLGHRASLSSLVGSFDLLMDEEPDDLLEADLIGEAQTHAVLREIEERKRIIGEDYPFQLDPDGHVLCFDHDLTPAANIYLFCLFLSHAPRSAILPPSVLPELDNATRDLFQVSSTFAAAGYVEGPAVSFGWPRPKRTKFADALVSVYDAFGDGTPRKKPLPGTPSKIKDGGIDIIAWRPPLDSLPGTQYLLGQVASGRNWKEKSVIEDSRLFHWAWFEKPPSTERQHAMFIPFCLEPEERKPGRTDQRQLLSDYLQVLTVQFGIVFYRYRLVAFAARALALHHEGRIVLERHDELHDIRSWVTCCRHRIETTIIASA